MTNLQESYLIGILEEMKQAKHSIFFHIKEFISNKNKGHDSQESHLMT